MTGISRRGGLDGECQRGQAGCSTPDGRLVEQVESGVREGLLVEIRGAGRGGLGDITQCHLVGDDQRDLFLPVQQTLQGVRVAPQNVVDTLAMGQAVARSVLVYPGPVRPDTCTVEV